MSNVSSILNAEWNAADPVTKREKINFFSPSLTLIYTVLFCRCVFFFGFCSRSQYWRKKSVNLERKTNRKNEKKIQTQREMNCWSFVLLLFLLSFHCAIYVSKFVVDTPFVDCLAFNIDTFYLLDLFFVRFLDIFY